MRWLAIFSLVAAQPVSAQVSPIAINADGRLQTIAYAPDQIVGLSVATGYQLMVRFGSGEVVETIAIGDSAAWQVTASKRGDLVFIKNIQANNVTNLTIVTDARIYLFELAPASGYGGIPAYSVSFVYPDLVKPVAERTKQEVFDYRVRGARAIRPARVFFDGTITAIEWMPDQPLPAVFSSERGQESLVNGEIKEGRYEIAGAPEKVIFRLNKLIAYAIRPTLQEQKR